ncbi:MAG: succinate--CoA ligase subunit alpha, partial [Deltaproteobacteria bacterium]
MTTLIDKSTRLAVQGITGKAASLHTRIMLQYGTQVVAGVRPGAAGRRVEDVPVFDTIADAVKDTGVTASVLFVPAYAIREAAFEALDADIKLLVIM